ncbi:DUF2259 domain-containing protein [Prosthecomicrobium sp. N25]|uniref:DUF2259 domain-containing protein n=1 Tax=Prosthecomicrobium sp. N25 TaxID=3129254 RepID=UPI003076D8A5
MAIPSALVRLAATLAVLAGLAPAAWAADAARRSIIGFSPDGAYFAFEEFGIQDGSAFPYANVYIIDTARDEWVRGSPHRVLLQSDQARLDQARSEARNAASDTLVRLAIGQQGEVIVSEAADRLEKAARFVAFTVPDQGPVRGLGTVRLRITEHQLQRAGCAFGKDLRGFVLQLEDAQGAPLRVMHEDREIPPSRGCPKGYGISEVQIFPRIGKGPVLVVIVSVYRFGFEGLDRRYIGIATAFDKNPQDPAASPAAEPPAPGPTPAARTQKPKPPPGAPRP